jgi:hypothetical protein
MPGRIALTLGRGYVDAARTLLIAIGHVSERMLSRYAHIRAQARRDAIATLENVKVSGEWAQKWAQCEVGALEDGKPPLQN